MSAKTANATEIAYPPQSETDEIMHISLGIIQALT